jgi:hypothetical protein
MTAAYERDWALYARSTVLMRWYGDDSDAFEGERGEIFLRIGPTACARTVERARELIERILRLHTRQDNGNH